MTIYSKKPRLTLYNAKLNNKFFQPNCLMCSLITCYILYLHSWSTCKCLLNTLLRNNTFSQHEYTPGCRFEIIWATTIIRICKRFHFKAIWPTISQHLISNTLYIPHNSLCNLPMRQTKIAQVSSKHINNKSNIRTYANLNRHMRLPIPKA